MTTPKVSIIYLSYNSLPYLEGVVSSWQQLSYPCEAFEIIIVDNASQDGSAQWIQEHVMPLAGGVLPAIQFFPQTDNLGFAAGNNLGITYAIEHGSAFVYLQNNDARLDPHAITHAVALAQQDPTIASVQSLMLLWQDPTRVNSTGGMVHPFGFGFVRDNGALRSDVSVTTGEEVFYGSGAATLYRVSCLKEAGVLDPFLFLYHEDLEWGWRLRLCGFRNVICMESIAYHYYEFSRSIKKLFWMERNRYLVHLSHLRVGTLVLLLPFMILAEPLLFVFAVRGGWWREKLRAWAAGLRPSTWRYIREKRAESALLRQVSDRDIVRWWTPVIAHQATAYWLVERVGNPLISLWWRVVRLMILW